MSEETLVQIINILDNQNNRIENLESNVKVLINANQQLIQYIDDLNDEFNDYKSNAPFELGMDMSDKGYWYPIIQNTEKTIELIKQGKSLARFGDGEFSTIFKRVRHRFQNQVDDRLSERLLEVLASDDDRLLIGLANNYGSLDIYSEQTKREIRRYLQRSVRKEHLSILSEGKVYYDAYLTRPYVLYADNDTDAPRKRFQDIRSIWNAKNVVLVEGVESKFGEGNDLLDNAASVTRIYGPAENAFNEYERILSECKAQNTDSLFLLALGPTATVLAYDLCIAGYQAVDVGHLDLEYEWMSAGMGRRVLVEGKYNNEIQI